MSYHRHSTCPSAKTSRITGSDEESLQDITYKNKLWYTTKACENGKYHPKVLLPGKSYEDEKAISLTEVAGSSKQGRSIARNSIFSHWTALAANASLRKLISHTIVPRDKPLVLIFAGPSGHGKTESARRLGHILSLELEVVDCIIFNLKIWVIRRRQLERRRGKWFRSAFTHTMIGCTQKWVTAAAIVIRLDPIVIQLCERSGNSPSFAQWYQQSKWRRQALAHEHPQKSYTHVPWALLTAQITDAHSPLSSSPLPLQTPKRPSPFSSNPDS